MTTVTSGLPHGVPGLAVAPPGVVSAPPREAMLGWRRPDGPAPSRPEDQLWLLGTHGGTGVSTLRRCLEQAGLPAADTGRAWPVPDGRPVLAVARTHGRGLASAQGVAKQYLSGHVPDGVVLLGCVLVPDGPGKLPRPVLVRARQLAGVFAETLAMPWAEEYRLLDPHAETDWPPQPEEVTDLAERIGVLIHAAKEIV